MSYKLFDRVMETSTTTGTGTLTLSGARPGHQSFGSRLSNSDSCTFCITDGVDFEVVEGVYSSDTLTRVTVKSSSNSDSKVSWSAGTKEVFLVSPAADLINAKGTNAFTADQSMGSNKLTDLAAPTSSNDALRYFDLLNNPSKKRVRCVLDSNVTLSSIIAGYVIDGVTLSAGNDVLVTAQTTGSQNGIYTVQTSSPPVRRNDFDVGITSEGSLIPCREGTNYADSVWMCTSNGAVIGTDAITFNLISFSTYMAGAGLVRSGNVLNVVGTSNRILVNANSIDIDSAYVGQSSITTLGTISTGVWNGTTIAVGYGGTGTTNGSITGSGSLTFTSTGSSSTIILSPGSSTGYVFHNGYVKNKGTFRDINAITYSGTPLINWSLSNFHSITLAGNPTFSFYNDKDGGAIHLAIKQPSSGNNTVTWPSGINWVEGSAPILATGVNKIDEVVIRRRGSGDYVGYLLTPSGGF